MRIKCILVGQYHSRRMELDLLTGSETMQDWTHRSRQQPNTTAMFESSPPPPRSSCSPTTPITAPLTTPLPSDVFDQFSCLRAHNTHTLGHLLLLLSRCCHRRLESRFPKPVESVLNDTPWWNGACSEATPAIVASDLLPP